MTGSRNEPVPTSSAEMTWSRLQRYSSSSGLVEYIS